MKNHELVSMKWFNFTEQWQVIEIFNQPSINFDYALQRVINRSNAQCKNNNNKNEIKLKTQGRLHPWEAKQLNLKLVSPSLLLRESQAHGTCTFRIQTQLINTKRKGGEKSAHNYTIKI